MSSKVKDTFSEADIAYKEELDTLVNELLLTKLSDDLSQPILLKLIGHVASGSYNISTLPKSLQFLIEHKESLNDLYQLYVSKSNSDTYSLVLLLELISFLEVTNSDDNEPLTDDNFSLHPVRLFKLLLYKLESNLIAERLLSLPTISNELKLALSSRKINDWGNEYLISLSNQLVRFFTLSSVRTEYIKIINNDIYKQPTSTSLISSFNISSVIFESLKLVESMTQYWLLNGFEFDAIDLLLEVDRIESICNKCSNDYDLVTRISTYLSSIASYSATYSESQRIFTVCYDLLFTNKRYAEALFIALKLNDSNKLDSIILSCNNPNIRKQLAFICFSNGIHLKYTKSSITSDNYSIDDSDLSLLNSLSSGEHLSGLFLKLCQELDVLESKHPSELFKGYPNTKSGIALSSQIDQTLGSISIDSAKDNLAYTFVNGFLNCGFGTDKLIMVDGSNWIFKHQDYGLLCATASLGLLNLWNIDEGLSQIDKYQYSTDSYVKSGAFAAFGLSSCSVVSESEPILGLLMDILDGSNSIERFGAILGLGFGYAGSCMDTLLEALIPCIIDDSPSNSFECSLFSSISLGLIYIGTGNQEASEAILQTLLEKEMNSSHLLDSPMANLYACALGLLQLRRLDCCEPLIEALSAIQHPFGKFAIVTVESFAFAGSGDVLRIQKLLKYCVTNSLSDPAGNHVNYTNDSGMDLDGPSNNTNHENDSLKNRYSVDNKSVKDNAVGTSESSMAILGIALVSLSESVGSAMIPRLMEQPLQWGTSQERKAVPLALAMVNVSNPNPQIVGILSKLTHDFDKDVCLNAIFALGIVGAGTNNSRISVILQNIARSNSRDSTLMFVLRLSVGLLYMGKGTTTLSPLHSEGFLINNVAFGGLLVTVMSALNIKDLIVDKMPYLMFFLALSIRPRWLITLSPNMEPIQIPVRVGNIVETICTAGKQRRISGFQTHKTPVLVGVSERAEIADENYVSYTPFLEGIVIVENNENNNIDGVFYN